MSTAEQAIGKLVAFYETWKLGFLKEFVTDHPELNLDMNELKEKYLDIEILGKILATEDEERRHGVVKAVLTTLGMLGSASQMEEEMQGGPHMQGRPHTGRRQTYAERQALQERQETLQERQRVPRQPKAPKKNSSAEPHERCLALKKDETQCTKKVSAKTEDNVDYCTLHNKYKPDNSLERAQSGTIDDKEPVVKKGKKDQPSNPDVYIDTTRAEPQNEPTEIAVNEDEDGHYVDQNGNIYDLDTQDVIGQKDSEGNKTWVAGREPV